MAEMDDDLDELSSRKKKAEKTKQALERRKARLQMQKDSRSIELNYKNLIESQAKALSDLERSYTKDEKDRLDRSMSLQMEHFDEQLNQYQKQFHRIDGILESTDKVAYDTFYKNRKNDLRRLERETRYRFNDMGESGEKLHDKLNDMFTELRDVINSFNISQITSSVTDSVDGLMEQRREMDKTLAWNDADWSRYNKNISDTVKKLNNNLSRTQIGEVGGFLTNEMGMDNGELINKYLKPLSEIQLVTNLDPSSIKDLVEQDWLTVGDGTTLKKLGDIATAIDESTKLEGITSDQLLTQLNTDAQSINMLTRNGTATFDELSKEFAGVYAASASAGFDPNALTDILMTIGNTATSELGDMAQQYGALNVMDIQKSLLNGDVDSAASQLYNQLDSIVGNQSLMNALGLGSLDPAMISDMLNSSPELFKESLSSASDILDNSIGNLQKSVDTLDTGIMNKLGNFITNLGPIKAISDLLGMMDLDMANAANAVIIAQGAVNGGKGLFGVGKSVLAKFGGGAAATAATATAAGGAAGGAGLLGTAGAVGTGAMLTGAAGALGAAGGIFSGLKDLWTSFKETDKDKKSDLKWSGNTKLGMVGAGAATGAAIGSIVPIVGTAIGGLVGAGIGGITAMFKGDEAGAYLKDKIDGSHKMGLNRVPFNGYLAELHEGESVLTKKEAESWRASTNSSSFMNFIRSSIKRDEFMTNKLSMILTGGKPASSAMSTTTDGVLTGSGVQASALTGDQGDFIKAILPGAIKARDQYKVLPSITLAQAALESGWGKAAIGNNLFGIKAGEGWTGKTQTVPTQEVINGQWVTIQDKFRDYDSIDDSILDHGKILTLPRYANVINASSYRAAAQALFDGGYATDPQYASKIINTVESSDLAQWEKSALSDLPQYKVGTPYVPNDQLAVVHKGEAIIPASQNPLSNAMRSTATGSNVGADNGASDIVDVIKWAVKRMESKLDEASRNQNQTTPVSTRIGTRSGAMASDVFKF